MKYSASLIDIKDRVLAVFFPERCVLCGDVVAYDDMWCGKCKCEKFGKIDCRIPHEFKGACAAMEYADKAGELLRLLKSKPDKRVLLFFAELMRDEILTNWPEESFDFIVPVPMTPQTLSKRGYNHAQKLAESLNGLIGAEVLPDALIRLDDTRIQHELNREERRINAAKSYACGNTLKINGKRVLLVDDIFTTGATAATCSGKLLKAGAKTVYVATAACVR